MVQVWLYWQKVKFAVYHYQWTEHILACCKLLLKSVDGLHFIMPYRGLSPDLWSPFLGESTNVTATSQAQRWKITPPERRSRESLLEGAMHMGSIRQAVAVSARNAFTVNPRTLALSHWALNVRRTEDFTSLSQLRSTSLNPQRQDDHVHNHKIAIVTRSNTDALQCISKYKWERVYKEDVQALLLWGV